MSRNQNFLTATVGTLRLWEPAPSLGAATPWQEHDSLLAFCTGLPSEGWRGNNDVFGHEKVHTVASRVARPRQLPETWSRPHNRITQERGRRGVREWRPSNFQEGVRGPPRARRPGSHREGSGRHNLNTKPKQTQKIIYGIA